MNPMIPTLHKAQRCKNRAELAKLTENLKYYYLSCAVAFADHHDGPCSIPTMFESEPSANGNPGRHAEELLVDSYTKTERVAEIGALNISYSPCSRCVVKIIQTFSNVERKPEIRFLLLHGKESGCIRRHAIANLLLLKSLGYCVLAMNPDKLWRYVVEGELKTRTALKKSRKINRKQLKERCKSIYRALSSTADDFQFHCVCRRDKCEKVQAIAFLMDDKKHEATNAFDLLKDIEKHATSIKTIYFPLFPSAIFVLRLVQVFLPETLPKPTICFGSFRSERMSDFHEDLLNMVFLNVTFEFEIVKCSSRECCDFNRLIPFSSKASLRRVSPMNSKNKCEKIHQALEKNCSYNVPESMLAIVHIVKVSEEMSLNQTLQCLSKNFPLQLQSLLPPPPSSSPPPSPPSPPPPPLPPPSSPPPPPLPPPSSPPPVSIQISLSSQISLDSSLPTSPPPVLIQISLSSQISVDSSQPQSPPILSSQKSLDLSLPPSPPPAILSSQLSLDSSLSGQTSSTLGPVKSYYLSLPSINSTTPFCTRYKSN